MAGSDYFAVLELSREGGAWDHLHRGDGSGCPSALAWKIVRLSMDALDVDGLRAASLHCQYRGMDDRGTRAAAVADLRIDAHRQRNCCAGGGGEGVVSRNRVGGGGMCAGGTVGVSVCAA